MLCSTSTVILAENTTENTERVGLAVTLYSHIREVTRFEPWPEPRLYGQFFPNFPLSLSSFMIRTLPSKTLPFSISTLYSLASHIGDWVYCMLEYHILQFFSDVLTARICVCVRACNCTCTAWGYIQLWWRVPAWGFV
jgi:hypothetical protein